MYKLKRFYNSPPMQAWGRAIFRGAIALCLLLLFPAISRADGIADSLNGMQPVLDQVYNEMLPLCARLIDVARGLAGFGALWYIASRVWRQMAVAEPIDFYPLLRPFALGMAVMMFPMVISVINGVMQPTVTATGAMVTGSNKAVEALLKQKELAVKNSRAYQMYVGADGNGDSDKWYKYTHPTDPERTDEGMLDGIGNDVKFWLDKQSYNFRNSIKEWMSEILQVVFASASLCINTIRTFFLIILAILGPLVFGLSVFDGFQQSLTQWLARYINIFLWLPIANVFGSIIGKIQEKMLAIDISQIQNAGDTMFSTQDTAYLIFLIIGIVGYFSVPTVANFVVHAHGGNAMLQRVTTIVMAGSSIAMQTGATAGSAGAGRIGHGAVNLANAPANIMEGYNSAGSSGSGSQHQRNKIQGS